MARLDTAARACAGRLYYVGNEPMTFWITRALGVLLAVLAVCRTTAPSARAIASASIDRRSLVSRHNPVLHRLDPDSPLTVGNGEFAFTADVTGLQTFAEAYDQTVPLGTLSQWGWHSSPNPEGWSIDTFHFSFDGQVVEVRTVCHPDWDAIAVHVRSMPAMMAAGWDGGPNRPAPGFPGDGSWVVRYEGLRKAP